MFKVSRFLHTFYFLSILIFRWRPHVFPTKSKEKGGVLLAGNVDGTITQWHAFTGKLLAKISEGDNQILALDYTVSGLNFASGGQDLKVPKLLQKFEFS